MNLKEDNREELSDETLELMLFKEAMFNKDFMSKLIGIKGFLDWFKTSDVRKMVHFGTSWFRKNNIIISKDILESIINKNNEIKVSNADKIDVTSALRYYSKARELDLGNIDGATKMRKIQEYVKRCVFREVLLDAAGKLDSSKGNTDSMISDSFNRFDEIQKILFEEMDFGFDFGENSDDCEKLIDEHIDYLANPDSKIPTNWKMLDEMTHGGFLRDGKCLCVFMAQAGLGKSNILSNLGYNFLKQGLDVLVISMEMSQNVYMRRFDSLISKLEIDALGFGNNVPVLKSKLTDFFKSTHSRLSIKEFPPGSKSSRDIAMFIDNIVEQKHHKPDVVIIDYLNLIKPNGKSSKGESSMYEDGKAVSEELRKLSYDFNIPVITAVQCNSSGYGTADIGMQNISESRGIAHTADFIAGLYQTDEERDTGIFHMKILKNRFGDKKTLNFHFNSATMEFTDLNDVDGTDVKDIHQTTSTAQKKSSSSFDYDDYLFGNSDKGQISDIDIGLP